MRIPPLVPHRYFTTSSGGGAAAHEDADRFTRFSTGSSISETAARGAGVGGVDRNHGYEYDYVVIGAGSGGIASALRAAAYGAKVAVVEKACLGGTCVNVGSVPKKVMWNAASIAETLHDMKHFGFSGYDSDAITFDWTFIKQNRDDYVRRLNKTYQRTMINYNITPLLGEATFTPDSPHTITLRSDEEDGGEVTTVTAQHVLIATGGYPAVPPGEGIREHAITSDEFFELEELPRRALVVGGGYIAVELAGILQALGTETFLVVRGDKAMREFDDLISDTLDEEMQRQGIEILRGTDGICKIVTDDDADDVTNPYSTKTVTLHDGTVIERVDTVLVATGRQPCVERLNLPSIGIAQDPEAGHILIDEFSNTNVNGVYAVGDVCGKVELTPVAIAAGRRLADRLFGGPAFANAKVSFKGVPTVVFSHPPMGMIGITEKEALERYGGDNVKIYRSKFSNLYYGPWQVEGEDKPKTAMKLVCAGKNETVVGLHVIGMGAEEMLQGFGVAMKMGATKADFDVCLAVHPTASEEFVTMFPWGLSKQVTGAKVSALNGAEGAKPVL